MSWLNVGVIGRLAAETLEPTIHVKTGAARTPLRTVPGRAQSGPGAFTPAFPSPSVARARASCCEGPPTPQKYARGRGPGAQSSASASSSTVSYATEAEAEDDALAQAREA